MKNRTGSFPNSITNGEKKFKVFFFFCNFMYIASYKKYAVDERTGWEKNTHMWALTHTHVFSGIILTAAMQSHMRNCTIIIIKCHGKICLYLFPPHFIFISFFRKKKKKKSQTPRHVIFGRDDGRRARFSHTTQFRGASWFSI